MTLSERLAAWSAALQWSDVPGEQRALVGLRVLDTAGLILAGCETEAARALSEFALEENPAMAALVYGSLAHCRDFDDTFLDSVVHPGSTVVGTALALGEALRAPDEEIATAIVAGYEAAARIGTVAGRRFHARGFHATGVVGPLSAALVAARLYRLPAAATADALGLAASMSGGLMAFVDDGTWSKWLHAGWSAHGGIIAAQLADRGFRGPRGVLDGRHNLFAAFIGLPAPGVGELCGDLGLRWAGGAAHFKYYPCAHVIQPYLDAAIALRERHRFAAEAIERVTCAIAPWAVPIVCTPRAPKLRPQSDMDAIASLPYQVAVALADGRVELDALGPACRARAQVLALAERIEHAADESLRDGFNGRIVIALKSGEVLQGAVSSAPPERAKVLAKFRANARRAVEKDTAAALERALTAHALPEFAEVALILGTNRCIQRRTR
jgi:2-methylcitrate dehydratase PrpD